MLLHEAKELKAGAILNPNIRYADAETPVVSIPYLRYGIASMQKVFPKGIYNADKTLMRFKVTSVKTWKRTPEKVLIKANRGPFEFYTLNEETIKFLVKQI